MKKIIAIILCALCLFDCLAGCAGGDELKGAYTKYGLKANDVVMTINGEDVTAQEYFFVADYCYNYFTQTYGQMQWTDVLYDEVTLLDYITEDALQSCIYYHIFATNAADEGGVPDENDVPYINAARDQMISDYFGDKSTFQTTLKEVYGMDEETFVNINVTVPYIYNKLFAKEYSGDFDVIADEEGLDNFIEENGYMKAAHILIKTVDDNFEPLDDATVAEKTALANELLERAQAGEDFFELMQEYSEDPGKETNPDGYEFDNSTSFVQEFKDGAASLEVGEIGMFESMYGYHIMLRVERDRAAIAETYCRNLFDQKIGQWCDDAEVVTTELYDKIDLSKMYEE